MAAAPAAYSRFLGTGRSDVFMNIKYEFWLYAFSTFAAPFTFIAQNVIISRTSRALKSFLRPRHVSGGPAQEPRPRETLWDGTLINVKA